MGDQISTDPLLGPLQNNGGPTLTHAPLPGSPAINSGDPNFVPPPDTDQRGTGFPRIVNAHIDKGSFEVQPGILGRVLTTSGRPIGNAAVILTDTQTMVVRTTIATRYGGYQFLGLTPGATYTITATQGRFLFQSQMLIFDGNLSNIDLVGVQN